MRESIPHRASVTRERSTDYDPEEHHIEVTKTARYWTLGQPEKAREVWLVLHGYKQLARRFLRRFTPIDDGTRLVVAPEALSRFYVSAEEGRHGSASVVGATWMTREDRLSEIADYVRYLDALAVEVRSQCTESDAPVTVLGFSQGVATAARWVTHGDIVPRRLVLWGDFSPPDLDFDRARVALEHVDVALVRGRQDRALSATLAQEESARLADAGIDYTTILYDGGHDIDADALVRLAQPDSTISAT